MKSKLEECLSILNNGIPSITATSPVFSPPQYADMDKKARDLFNNGYYLGVVLLDLKTQSHNNVEMSTSWAKSLEGNKLYGAMEAKYQLADYNFSLTEKLNKNCLLNTELSYKNKSLKGLTFSVGGTFSPRIGLLKTEWSNRYCSFNSDFRIGNNFSFLISSIVLGSRRLMGGLQWKYDIHNDKQAELNFAVAYNNDDLCLHTYVNNGNECGGSIYHKIAPEIDLGMDIKWWTNGAEPLYGVAGRYEFDKGVFVRGKINNSSELAFSYEQKLNEGISLITSTLFDLRNVAAGKHKFGLAINLHL